MKIQRKIRRQKFPVCPVKREKYFPLMDCLNFLKEIKMSRLSQIYLFSLIAHFHEKQRVAGSMIDDNIMGNIAKYTIFITTSEMESKFGFSKTRIDRIQRELSNKFMNYIDIKPIEIVGINKKYHKLKLGNVIYGSIHPEPDKGGLYYLEEFLLKYSPERVDLVRRQFKKYLSFNYQYIFELGGNIIDIPVKIIYEKNLKPSEKLALIWAIKLRRELNNKLKLIEIERMSGISERTIRKAKNRYPRYFN